MLQYVQLDTGMRQYNEGQDILMTYAEEIDLRGNDGLKFHSYLFFLFQ